MTAATAAFKVAAAGVNMADSSDIPTGQWSLVEDYRQELLAQALAIVKNAEDAEDVVQETFTEAFRHAHKLAQAHSLGAWLHAINHANALDFLRNKKARAESAERKERELPSRPFTTGGINAVEVHDLIAEAIDSLPPDDRTVMVLHYWQHLTCEQIAEKLSMPAGTVKWLLAEASLRLHHRLKPVIETGCYKAIDAPPPLDEEDDDEKGDSHAH